MITLGLALFAIATFSLGLLTVQYAVMRLVHLRRQPPIPREPLAISVLKPLCGVDDDLARNLEQFATLDYPDYEVVLGVRDADDPAYPVAKAAVARWPERMRLEVQRGEPGLNPKVNQLITLVQHARHEIVLVSDSNVRVPPGYLDEIAAHLADPGVGLVTNPVVGIGEQRLGSLLDNLHMTSGITAGAIAAKIAGGHDLVVGKSMAMRKADLKALGGFESCKDVLAEDHLIGKWTPKMLGKRVVICRTPVYNVTQRRKVVDFLRRYQRWAVMQRAAVGNAVYTAQLLLNPLVFALAGLAVSPSLPSAGLFAAVLTAKLLVDGLAFQAWRPTPLKPLEVLSIPLKDALVFAAWVYGLTHSKVNWRGNELVVLPGTRLAHRRRVRFAELEEAAALASREEAYLASEAEAEPAIEA
jgi:ceramide glucosyltransferase